MPSTSQLIKHHRRRLEKHQKTSLQRGGFSLALLISIFFFGGVFSLVAFYASTTKNLPSIQSLPSLLNPADGMLMQPTRFYDRTGTHILYTLQNPGINERGYLTINSDVTQTETKANFSEHLITATIAISDPTFWNNPGYSLLGIEKNELAPQVEMIKLESPPERKAGKVIEGEPEETAKQIVEFLQKEAKVI